MNSGVPWLLCISTRAVRADVESGRDSRCDRRVSVAASAEILRFNVAESPFNSAFDRRFFFCRVDWGLPMLQADVCVLCCRLVSRRCHNISAIHQLHPSPSQNRTSGFPTSGSSLKHSAGSYPCSVCGHSISRLESCLCFSSHGCLSAGTFTPRGLAASSLNQFPSHCRDAV